MAEEKREALKSEFDGIKLTVPGTSQAYFSGAPRKRPVGIEVRELFLEGIVSRDEAGETRHMQTLYGRGTIDPGTRLRVAGWGDGCDELVIGIHRSPTPGTVRPWEARISFHPVDDEGMLRDEWWCDFFLGDHEFDALVAAHRAGEVETLHAQVRLDAWVTEYDLSPHPDETLSRYLVPRREHASKSPEPAHGEVRRLIWKDLKAPEQDEPRTTIETKADPAVSTVASAELGAYLFRLEKTCRYGAILVAAAIVVGWFT
ncbi:hypothetical protein [Chelatococcus asaccharovorans]|uniref:Uncharacterized protein n=1 Tax=Chelatococcus asaccharovorans TaxID=28210 RepID=A0A2V3UAT3_9HYPH|nr:hypothetical protein [Chelatococcus asaccharovorans]MBS7703300.1 hypothetical protein [Chelatococcus asaccharovorans]PXW61634.1 hypothetical protein C7450_103151 [Chelatococcus asaccharovorans]